MEINSALIEKSLYKKLRINQLLFCISVLLAITFVAVKSSYVFWALCFAIMGLLCLPNINHSKEDLVNYRKNQFTVIEGKVLDVFPEKKKDNENWVIFMEVDGEKNVQEFIVSANPEVEVNSVIKLHYTNKLRIPVKIEAIV